MKKLLFILFIFFFIFPGSVLAKEEWTIEKFHSDIEIKSTGEIRVAESIQVNYSIEKHGIYRDIPVVYEDNGTKTYTEIVVEAVSRDDKSEKYQIIKNPNYLQLKIGDPNKTITGEHAYVITYSVKGVLRGFEDHDELFWNVTGNNWDVPLKNVSSRVYVPFEGITKITCFQGATGSKDPCISRNVDNQQAIFGVESLNPYEGLTIVFGYRQGEIPILSVEAPKTFTQKFTSFPSIVTLTVILIFGIGLIIFVWYNNGRDFWFGSLSFMNKTRTSVKPIGAKEQVVVEYEPPDNLRPAEIGVLMDERADTMDVVATIIDLAARGFLTITEEEKKWIFGSSDYILSKTKKETKELEVYERDLFESLFKDGDTVKLSTLKTKFYDELKKVKDHLYVQVVRKNLFPKNPEKVRGMYLLLGIIMIVFAWVIMTIFASNFDNIYVIDVLIGLMVCGVVLSVFSFFMPRRTAHGRELYRRVKGYREFIEHTEKYRQKFFEKENMFNTVLPYAMMFGLTEKFANAMKDLGIEHRPTWYHGSHAFNSRNFASSMVGFSNSVSSAIASTPKSSGFSGGGSSGGGFGGGGGGSW